MRIFVRYHKEEALRYLSHLDIQRLLQRALRRASIPVAYSQGFNPHPLLAFASALPVGYTSEGEWADIRLSEELAPDEFAARINRAFPPGFSVGEVIAVPDTLPTLTALTAEAHYRATLETEASEAQLQAGMEAMLSGLIVVRKRTKAGERDVDIRPQLLRMELLPGPAFHIEGVLNVDGSLSVELLLAALFSRLGIEGAWKVHRTGLYFSDTCSLLPQAERVKEPI